MSNWIEGAIKKPGAFRAKAARAGESTSAYASEKAHAPGKLGQQARLAKTLMGMPKHANGAVVANYGNSMQARASHAPNYGNSVAARAAAPGQMRAMPAHADGAVVAPTTSPWEKLWKIITGKSAQEALGKAANPTAPPNMQPQDDISAVRKAAEEAGKRNEEANAQNASVKKYACGGVVGYRR